MKNSVKFTFDTHFDAPSTPSDTRGLERSRKSYSAEEIDQIRETAREEGRRASDIRATQAVAASIGQVASAVLSAVQAMDGEIEAIRAESAALAFSASKKLAGAALAAVPDAEIAQALNAALHQAIGEPRVVVKTPPGLASKIEGKAAEIAAEQGFEGRIQFIADAELSGADCRIEWRGGGIERSHRLIEQALADLIARRFAGPGTNTKE
jgi:flagellar assembly protein FliH